MALMVRRARYKSVEWRVSSLSKAVAYVEECPVLSEADAYVEGVIEEECVSMKGWFPMESEGWFPSDDDRGQVTGDRIKGTVPL